MASPPPLSFYETFTLCSSDHYNKSVFLQREITAKLQRRIRFKIQVYSIYYLGKKTEIYHLKLRDTVLHTNTYFVKHIPYSPSENQKEIALSNHEDHR